MYIDYGTSYPEEKDSKRLAAEAATADLVANLKIRGIHPTTDEIKDLTLVGLGLMTKQEFIKQHVCPTLSQYL